MGNQLREYGKTSAVSLKAAAKLYRFAFEFSLL
jgi:hypothetical protein